MIHDQDLPTQNRAILKIGGLTNHTVFMTLLLDKSELITEARSIVQRCQSALSRSARLAEFTRPLLAALGHIDNLLAAGTPRIETIVQARKQVCWSLRDYWDKIRSAPEIGGPAESWTLVESALADERNLLWELRRCTQMIYDDTEAALLSLRSASKQVSNRSMHIDPDRTKDIFAFISHTDADAELATAVSHELSTSGVKAWTYARDIQIGDSIPDEIAASLEMATHFILIYSEMARKRPWIRKEVNSALMRQGSQGLPKIITLLKDNVQPPSLLQDTKGIRFDDYAAGMDALWTSLGIPHQELVTPTSIYRFLRLGDRILEAAKWCGQADSFLAMRDDTFDELSDAELLLVSQPLPPNLTYRPRFVRTDWIHTYFDGKEEVQLAFDEDFYTYEFGHIAGAYLLARVAWIANRLRVVIAGH